MTMISSDAKQLLAREDHPQRSDADRPAFVLPPADRVLRAGEVVARTGLSIETIYRRIRAQQFPNPVRLGPGAVGWRETAVNGWIASLPDVEFEHEEVERPAPTRGRSAGR